MKTKKLPEKHVVWLDHGCYPGKTLFINGYNYKDTITYLRDLLKTEQVNKELLKAWIKVVQEFKSTHESYNWFCGECEIFDTKTRINKKFTLVVLPTGFDGTDEDYCRLAHELIHLGQFYLSNVLDRNVEIEAEAYFHTYMMMQVLEVLNN